MKSETIRKLEATLARLGRNRLLELKLRHLPKDFTFFERESDEMVLGRCLMEKYDVSPGAGQGADEEKRGTGFGGTGRGSMFRVGVEGKDKRR